MFPKTRTIHLLLVMPTAVVTAFNSRLDANLSYNVFPTRSTEEAAVVEWGSSAIISALDAAVATFGPQTSLGAFFEVETAPILAVPVNGIGNKEFIDDGDSRVPYPGPLDNRDDVTGNLVVMTNEANLSGVTMARIAKESGAAALMVVNIDDEAPDYIYSLSPNTDKEEKYAEDHIDIPVIMVSLASGNLITTATVEEGMEEEDIVNNGMPDRVRLYAAGDRPFFEDVSHDEPIVYLIHNLLSAEECDSLIRSAEGRMQKVDDVEGNLLENIVPSEDHVPRAVNIEGMVLWKGLINSHTGKQVEERIEQVTGYPCDHFSDWHVRKYDQRSKHELHYDWHPINSAIATITVFLNEVQNGDGGEIVYPKSKQSLPIKIVPNKGMAVVHHNTDQEGKYESTAMYGELPTTGSVKYIAKKYIYAKPHSHTRRIILPLIAILGRGALPRWVIKVHDAVLSKYGIDKGTIYFEKLCIFCPLLLLLIMAQVCVMVVKRKFSDSAERSNIDKSKKKKKA